MTICTVNKIDSNFTGLSFAEEVCLKQLPTVASDGFDPTWYALEPNSYSDFGGDLTTVARQPISATRQRKKGTVTDLSASAGFNNDLTASNLVRLMQGFFFANARQKASTIPLNGVATAIASVASSDKSFNAGSGLSKFFAGHIVKSSDFNSANNGRHLVATVSDTKVTVAETLVDQGTVASTARLHAVGFRFPSGVASLTASSTAAILSITGVAIASGTFTVTSSNNALAGETVTIGSIVYTFQATPGSAYQVMIGADRTASMVNLAAAVNASAGSGSLYGAGTLAHPTVTATSGTGTLIATAKVSGTAANSIATTDTVTSGSWASATLIGGTGVGFDTLGLKEGEYIFVGGDLTATQFAIASSTNRPGYARINSFTYNSLSFNDTTWTPQTDAGTGKTIEIFFGTLIRNEPLATDIVTRSYQFERTLGSDDVGTQAQYVTGSIANEFTLNVPSAEKITADLKYISLDEEVRTGTQGLKIGSRVASPGEDAYNTSHDIYRVRMAVVDPTQINNQAMFGYVQEATITINNNASANKALGYVGGFAVSAGNFDAGGSITAYFTQLAAIQALRNNANINYNLIVAAANKGFIFDMPLLGVSGGRLNVALNQPVTLPLTPSGAQNANGYTLASIWFSYLPDAAMPV